MVFVSAAGQDFLVFFLIYYLRFIHFNKNFENLFKFNSADHGLQHGCHGTNRIVALLLARALASLSSFFKKEFPRYREVAGILAIIQGWTFSIGTCVAVDM